MIVSSSDHCVSFHESNISKFSLWESEILSQRDKTVTAANSLAIE